MSQLKELIACGQGDQLDFISRIGDLHEVAKTLVAFANSNGGKLMIGVKENGKILGVNPQEEKNLVSEISSALCKPALVFESVTWKEKHHLVLEIKVVKSAAKIQTLDKDGSWQYYIRNGIFTLPGNKIMERIWTLEKYDNKGFNAMDETTSSLVEIIRNEESVTLSRLYKISELKNQEIDKILANLVFCNRVKMTMNQIGTFYSVL